MLEQKKLPYSVDVEKSRVRFKEIRSINIIVLKKASYQDISIYDMEKLLDMTYGERVRLGILNENYENLMIDLVIDTDKSVSYCEPYEICEDLGLEIK